jgi:hypothetical protein
MKNPRDMTRWEAMDALGEALLLIKQEKWGSLCLLLGITDEIAGSMPFTELTDIVTVRLSDLAFVAGVSL